MAEKKKVKHEKASMSVGERVIPNPKGIKPENDTDVVAAPKMESLRSTATEGAATYNIENSQGNSAEPETVRSFKKGTPYVPRTGFYQLHEGEAVIPKEKNTMNSSEAMGGITKGSKKPRKALKSMKVHATDNGRHVVTHEHHHSEHHKDESHAMSSMEELMKHMTDNAPKIEPQAPGADESEAAPSGGPAPAGPAPTPGM